MSEENVGTPAGDAEARDAATGYGFVVGIVVALVTIGLLVYFLLLTPGSTVPASTGGQSPRTGTPATPPASAPAAPSASAWRLVWLG